MELNASDFDFNLPKDKSSIIKVIGVGGAGNNALKYMYEKKIHGVDFVICNTDAQALDNNPVTNKIQLGPSITDGLGAGAEPEVGERAAVESMDEIKAILGQNTKMVFITAGLGGGTGTGAAPVIAKVAKEMGILTIGIVTIPFAFEGKRRLEQAEIGLEKLKENVDSLIVINNDTLRSMFGNLGFRQAFSKADEILTNAAKGMAEVITAPFAINIDFRDAKTVLQNSGTALMSTGIATGENRAEEAVRKALDSPLLNNNKITGAKDVLLLILSGSDENFEARMDEIGLITDYVQSEAGGNNNANVIFGVGTEEDLGEAIKVLVIATGFAPEYQKQEIIREEELKPEKVTISLDGKLANQPSSVGAVNAPQTPSQPVNPQNEMGGSKKVFRLEDTDDFSTPTDVFTAFPEGNANLPLEQKSPMEVAVLEEEEPVGISFVDVEESPMEEKETKVGYDLFSYNDEELEAVSYTFDIEDTNEHALEIKEEETSQAFNFNIHQEENSPSFEIPREDEKTELKVLIKEEPIKEVVSHQNTITEKEEPIVKVEQKEEFIIVDKKAAENPKVQERRNKLREFNSRYQVNENEDFFETIPAFKRRNVAIDLENASDQNISTFYSEENGRVVMRENKFLNKDVD